MIRLPRWKVIACLAALLFGVLFTLPNVLPESVMAQVPSWLPHQRLNLGLDLQGGSYLLEEVDLAALKTERLVNLTEDTRTTLRDKKVLFSDLRQTKDDVVVRITDPTQFETAFKELSALGNPLPNGGGKDVSISTLPDQRIRLYLSERALTAESVAAVHQSIEIIRRRVDQLGAREPTIIQQGTNRIVVEAPGESDPERLKSVIGQTAKLSFQMLDDSVSPDEAASGLTPPDSVLIPGSDPREPQYVIKRRALVTGEMLVSASQGFDQNGQAAVQFRFNGQGAKRFADATLQNIGKRFAIVLDNKVISAPVIQTPITGGNGQITGNFTVESASDLALLLRSGALPAPLKVVEQRTVGAELGADAIRAGQISLAIGTVAIFIFIIMAYGLFGCFAAVALVVNGLMIVGVMTLSHATLTLPGIAGVVLTLAVAIDANVLIYERMRDESRSGRTLLASVDHGYALAYPSIFDANLTSLIAAAIMYFAGAGPVKGFALTLGVGVLTSVFTAILVTQVLIGWWFRIARPKKLPI